MSSKSVSEDSNGGSESDYSEEGVDPRVQGELEKLNSATDEINRLEVDLDEARSKFRQLLCSTTLQIDALGKKLGSCVERARPYYDARIRAKEALLETQKAAVKFERANSAHTAAKEMVYLAEEGLKTEGRTFDHAWQEMLNHATMRVNESEHDRTVSEAEHRCTSQAYHEAERIVQQLQKDLKRSITKSRPYFELKSQYNQQLEEQKQRVKRLETRVGQAKASYAEALRNLEQISDEIHKIRNSEVLGGFTDPLGVRGLGVGAESPHLSSKNMRDSNKSQTTAKRKSKAQESCLNSKNPKEGFWSDSRAMDPLMFNPCDEYRSLPHKLGPAASPVIPQLDDDPPHISQYLGLSGLSGDATTRLEAAAKLEEEVLKDAKTTRLEAERRPSLATSTPSFSTTPKKVPSNPFLPISNPCEPNKHQRNNLNGFSDANSSQTWTAINLADSSSDNSPSPLQSLSTGDVKPGKEGDIPYEPLEDNRFEENPFKKDLNDITPLASEKMNSANWHKKDMNIKTGAGVGKNSTESAEVWTEVSLNDEPETPTTASLFKKVSFFNSNFTCDRARNSSIDDDERRSSGELSTPGLLSRGSVSLHGTPLKQRMKLDSGLVNWISRSSAAADEPTPNSASQGSPTLGSRRQSLDTLLWNGPASERVKDILSQGIMMLNISSLTERRSSEPRTDKPIVTAGGAINPMAVSYAPGFEQSIVAHKRPLKKVPSPLEKSLSYLTAEDDSASDTDSLHSLDMLTDDQISSLMLEPNLQEVCQDVLGTPISEVLPGYPSNKA